MGSASFIFYGLNDLYLGCLRRGSLRSSVAVRRVLMEPRDACICRCRSVPASRPEKALCSPSRVRRGDVPDAGFCDPPGIYDQPMGGVRDLPPEYVRRWVTGEKGGSANSGRRVRSLATLVVTVKNIRDSNDLIMRYWRWIFNVFSWIEYSPF